MGSIHLLQHRFRHKLNKFVTGGLIRNSLVILDGHVNHGKEIER